MELKEFIKDTINQIDLALEEIYKERQLVYYYGDKGVIEFDLLVNVENSDSTKLGGGIKVLSFNAGGEKGDSNKTQNSQRIKFSLCESHRKSGDEAVTRHNGPEFYKN